MHVSRSTAPEATVAGGERYLSGWQFFLVYQVIFWGLFGLLFFLAINPYHPFLDVLLLQTAATVALGLATSSVIASTHSRLVGPKPGPLALLIGIPIISVLLGVAWYALASWMGDLIDPFELSPVRLPSGPLFARTQMPLFPLVLLLWSVLALAAYYVREQHDHKERVLRSEALAHEAKLRMLRYQLNPHFLFNALNSIGSLADEAPERIQPVVGELSRFLRYSLLDADRLEVPLGDELRAVEYYLEVEKVRFEEDLDALIEVEPAAAKRVVPAFVVLPLVENAVKHGRHTSSKPLHIRIAGRIDGDTLCVDVENSGSWIAADSAAGSVGTRTGLENVRQRLRAHYPGNYRLDVDEKEASVCVSIRISNDN
jgi:hypothetical protein